MDTLPVFSAVPEETEDDFDTRLVSSTTIPGSTEMPTSTTESFLEEGAEADTTVADVTETTAATDEETEKMSEAGEFSNELE